MRFVFLHGGPGFNSFAEQAILRPLFESAGHEIVFWNEPSRLRPKGDPFDADSAFECWLASAERTVLSAGQSVPVHVITHSITIHGGMEIARRHPHRVASLVAVGPAADVFATFVNVLRRAHEDLTAVKPDIAARIGDALNRTRVLFDEAMRDGLLDSVHDDQLFRHYWADRARMEESLAARARPDGQFDGESFFAVLDGFTRHGAAILSNGTVTVPTLALFGDRDRITPLEEQRAAMMAAIPGVRLDVLEGCSHYLHLDRAHDFVRIAGDWAKTAAPSS